MQQDYFFVHYQVKLCVGRVKDILVDNFAKKGWVFCSGLMTGGMEKPLDMGKANKSQCFKKTDINGPGWHFISWMIGWQHIMQRQNNITTMFFYFWAVWCAMPMLDSVVYSLCGFHKTPRVYLSTWVRVLYNVFSKIIENAHMIMSNQRGSCIFCPWNCKVCSSPWCIHFDGRGNKASVYQ